MQNSKVAKKFLDTAHNGQRRELDPCQLVANSFNASSRFIKYIDFKKLI